ncbi:tigger transposable element-derived protein 1-like [Octopus bimaculoides]|uniref:tigger transposable element-derived protein 1-like n=1 Tax=Octopus bimaculoides TaxID=37653 RepID=UPI00071CABF9|nr:tigger transposable element-derived protein 1-like [Octopus bimaculoides]|eukprot:XP_014782748.1 PREDICTED: tigger transposable element-derived protein 1-like [Octopus bimaculoides]
MAPKKIHSECAMCAFNVDETGLYWKKLPDRSFIFKEEKTIPGYKITKERVTIILGDWFFNRFIPAAEKYCKEKEIPFKVLLISDNAPGHPQNIIDFDLNVTVVYLPPNTMSLLQPMDQGIIVVFKRYYMKRTLRQAITATDLDESITLRDFWKIYDIYKVVQDIAAAGNDVQSTAMNGVWKKLCLQFANTFKWFDNVTINKTQGHAGKVLRHLYSDLSETTVIRLSGWISKCDQDYGYYSIMMSFLICS